MDEERGQEGLRALAIRLAGRVRPGAFGHLAAGTTRRWQRVLAVDACEAWVIGWPPGTGLAAHDHGDSGVALFMLSGRLLETRWSEGRPTSTDLRVGSCSELVAGATHQLVNPGADPALSVHVYSPRLSSMTFYEPRDDGMVVVRVGDELVGVTT